MSDFPELDQLEALLPVARQYGEVRLLNKVQVRGREFPIYGLVLGSTDKKLPTLGIFGGVHGLERVGSQVLLSYLEGLFSQLSWDADLRARLEKVRIATIPIVNPGGMWLGWRSNPHGVDLMRNAPVEALVKPLPILGGHRVGPHLPYYRGPEGAPMEIESQTLVNFVKEEVFESESSLVLDLHSGFGAVDRLWYPYAKTTDPFPRLDIVDRLSQLLSKSHPNHVYKVEPQSLSYTTHGDLWDYLFDQHGEFWGRTKTPPFIPWTLEMGSWLWIRKNPAQIFNPLGVFNPIKTHRLRRTLRRHVPLLDFFLRAVKHHKTWNK